MMLFKRWFVNWSRMRCEYVDGLGGKCFKEAEYRVRTGEWKKEVGEGEWTMLEMREMEDGKRLVMRDRNVCAGHAYIIEVMEKQTKQVVLA